MPHRKAAHNYSSRGWAPDASAEVGLSDIPPFNSSSSYSIPPGELVDKDRQAIAANEMMANTLGHIDRSLAYRLRQCRPGSYCRARKYCALCSPIQEKKFCLRYRSKFLKLSSAAHLILTTRARPQLTRANLTAIVRAFNKLKERKRFKRSVRGGIVNFQIKYGASGWLPHAHALLDYSGGLSNTWLKETWTALGGGFEIKFKPVRHGDEPKVLAYGARKQNLPHDPGLLRQFHEATLGFIAIRPWGSFHHLSGRKPRQETHQ